MKPNSFYTEILMRHYKKPSHKGSMRKATHHEIGHNQSCGDQIDVWVDIKKGMIQKISQETIGCMLNKSSASIMASCVAGKSVDEALEIVHLAEWIINKSDESVRIPDDLPDMEALRETVKYPTRSKCMSLAWETLEKILEKS